MDAIILSVLEELEWKGIYSYCTGWPCCPMCRSVKPGFGGTEPGPNDGHRPECTLAKALKWQRIVRKSERQKALKKPALTAEDCKKRNCSFPNEPEWRRMILGDTSEIIRFLSE